MKKEEKELTIKQVNSPTPLNDLEKTAIFNFVQETKEEDLSKTQKFRLLNAEKESFEELPKKKERLSDTIRLKLSDLREKKEEEKLELPSSKKSLYDTVIIKLDDLINRKNALKYIESKKVKDIEETDTTKKTMLKKKKLPSKLSVTSTEFGKYLYLLNKVALNQLSETKTSSVRKRSTLFKLQQIEKITISKENYKQYEKELNKFAINKLYYKFAPKETKKYKIYKYSFIGSCLLLVLSLSAIFYWYIEGTKSKEIQLSILDDVTIEQVYKGEIIPLKEDLSVSLETQDMYTRYINTPLSSIDFAPIKEVNEDTIGWLIVPNTNVNYPVVQTNNNEYYLKHAFDKSSNKAGWVFADFRNTFEKLSKNTVIYAHGRKDRVMFGSLTDALNPEWYEKEENQIIQFSTPEYNTMWQIFSIYKIKAESYYITTEFSTEDSFSNFTETMKKRSVYDFHVPLTKEDNILTLSTCYNDQGIRLVIQAKLVKQQKR